MKVADILGLLGRTGTFPVWYADDEFRPGGCRRQPHETYFGNVWTSNRFWACGSRGGITAVIQSSSATTVMVVGFVNSE